MYSPSFTSSTFHRTGSIWINCTSFTYHPHSNECDPRLLLAATIMAIHPIPSADILLPTMHPNIVQICRWWVASIIIQGTFDRPPFQTLFQMHIIRNCLTSLHMESIPYNLDDIYQPTPQSQEQPPSSSQLYKSFDPLSPMLSPNDFLPHQKLVKISSNQSPLLLPKEGQFNEEGVTSDHPTNMTTTMMDNQMNQPTISKWLIHRPFIPNLPLSTSTSSFHPSHHHQEFTAHLLPFGTSLFL